MFVLPLNDTSIEKIQSLFLEIWSILWCMNIPTFPESGAPTMHVLYTHTVAVEFAFTMKKAPA